eukprot:Skav227211  [mRNA]  locus=scaffold2048:335560:349311:- [translate_table: standard]
MAEAALDAAPSKSLAVPSKAVAPVPEALTKAIPVVPDALSKALPVPDALSKAPPVPDALSKAAPPVPEALFKAPPEVPSKAAPPADSGKPKSLVLGDETFVFAAGLQEAYQDMDFTACSVLSTQNITAKDANPFPPVMKGRVRHMVNPVTIGKTFPAGSFDELVFFLPGLSFSVPKELGTSDRPLFAYRVHHFVFHLLRSSKLLLKGEGQLHVVWPEETCLMSSPCGAAGIELVQLLTHLGCKQSPAKYSMEPIKAECIKPMVFGGFCTELPEWLQNLQMLSFSLDMKPIPVPLSVALQLNPDLELVSIKGAANVAGVESPPENAPLKAKLIHEAIARKARLKDLYGPRNPQETVSNYDLVKEALAPDPDALLSIPMEAFMMTLDELPHFSNCLKYQVASMVFDPLDKTLVSLGEDGKVCEWSTENWSSINEYGVHGEAVAVATAGAGQVWAGVAGEETAAFRSFHNGVHQEKEDFVLHSSEHIISMDLHNRPSEARNTSCPWWANRPRCPSLLETAVGTCWRSVA